MRSLRQPDAGMDAPPRDGAWRCASLESTEKAHLELLLVC
jgi:hypothetical protein